MRKFFVSRVALVTLTIVVSTRRLARLGGLGRRGWFDVQLLDAEMTRHALGMRFAGTGSSVKGGADRYSNRDASCPFRNSSLYRKVYVYPTFNGTHWIDDGFTEGQLRQIVTKIGTLDTESVAKSNDSIPAYPWVVHDEETKLSHTVHYSERGANSQFSTEIIFRSMMTHAESCLRTYDPNEAILFYVPYMVSIEFRMGKSWPPTMDTSPYGQAIIDILEKQRYEAWENLWGLSSEYWKRRGGADHVLVYSEPLHGLWHPRMKRGSFHFLKSQYQLKAPIAVSVELSTAFVNKYPKCSAKNILLPYPEPDGRWYNGVLEKEVRSRLESTTRRHLSEEDRFGNGNVASLLHLAGMLDAEKSNTTLSLASPHHYTVGWEDHADDVGRAVAYYYSGGNHGTCKQMRVSLGKDFKECSSSYAALLDILGKKIYYTEAMQMSTFCIATGGDSPSAKRMFDAVLAGCIPIILSKDFVWPFSKEYGFGPVDPSAFSLRWNSKDFRERRLHPGSCRTVTESLPGLQEKIEQIGRDQIQRLRTGLKTAANAYSYFQFSATIPDDPMRQDVLPDGGLAHAIVAALAARADGSKWRECEEELKTTPQGGDPRGFEC